MTSGSLPNTITTHTLFKKETRETTQEQQNLSHLVTNPFFKFQSPEHMNVEGTVFLINSVGFV